MMAKKLSRAEKIRRYLTAHPSVSVTEVAKKFDTTYQIVYMIKTKMPKKIVLKASEVEVAKRLGVNAEEYAKQKAILLKQKKIPKLEPTTGYSYAWIDTVQLNEASKDALASKLATRPAPDLVNHPSHYKTGGIETIDFIEAKELNYNMGNAVKYISRAEHKGDKKQDLEKAVWYLNREIGKL